ncbi:hypothetical protein KGF54_005479 [Candida jiufengensis]|uniref:uncharacterized protein n=1 Tax=Candida jiufengensis TaxID=497108 RepID=UPI002224DD7B|nr:uncharacterized protein KGF54_005479 [Candida jiufengensis]KAI5949602.1 hypothetical protein KGF54_005479 [Candida jiufengensis]
MTDYKPINHSKPQINDDDLFTNNNNNINDSDPYFATPPPPFPPNIELGNMNENTSSQAQQDKQDRNTSRPGECTPDMCRVGFCMGVGLALLFISSILITAGDTKLVKISGIIGLFLSVFLIFVAGCIVFDVHTVYGQEKFLKFVGLGLVGTVIISIVTMIITYSLL